MYIATNWILAIDTHWAIGRGVRADGRAGGQAGWQAGWQKKSSMTKSRQTLKFTFLASNR